MKEYENVSLPAKERAKALLAGMTLKEKIGQLNQRLYGFGIYETVTGPDGEKEIILSDVFRDEVEKYGGLGSLYGLYRADPWSGRNYETGLCGPLAKKAFNAVQSFVMDHSRQRIPALMSSECPHGHQALDGYLLPVNLAAGASFHPGLVKRAYGVCGRQLKAMGVSLALLSMLDVLRDPRWGRSEECYSEDPYLCSRMAEAAVTGMQDTGVAVVAKHFAAQGETTGGVNASAARIGERELREIHFPPMRAAAEAGVKGVMAAYNEIDGIYCHANRWLLTDVLRSQMGFDGMIMSDGCAIDQLDDMTQDNAASAALALSAGVDMGLWDTAFGRLEEALLRGLIEEEQIDRAALRVLTLKFEQGLFEQPPLKETEEGIRLSYTEYPESLQLARESAVLLKNEGSVLPLCVPDHPAGELPRIAVIGPNADQLYHQLGDYTPPVRAEDGVTVLEGIRRLFTGSGDRPSWQVSGAKGCYLRGGSEEMRNEAAELAAQSDVSVLVLGGSSSRFSGAAFDINGAALPEETGNQAGEDRGPSMDCGEGMDCMELSLPKEQLALLESVAAAGKPVVTVVICGRPLSLREVCDLSSAVLLCFYPGPMGGQAVAELLAGAVNPSGRLPASLPRKTGQIPVYYNYRSSYQAMRYMDGENGPLFPFGYGLDYTQYRYTDIRFLKTETENKEGARQIRDGVTLAARIRNVGSMAGFAVPMLFATVKTAKTAQRVKELKAFDKIQLGAGEEKEIILHLPGKSFYGFDSKLCYHPQPGVYGFELSEKGKTIWRGELELCI